MKDDFILGRCKYCNEVIMANDGYENKDEEMWNLDDDNNLFHLSCENIKNK